MCVRVYLFCFLASVSDFFLGGVRSGLGTKLIVTMGGFEHFRWKY